MFGSIGLSPFEYESWTAKGSAETAHRKVVRANAAGISHAKAYDAFDMLNGHLPATGGYMSLHQKLTTAIFTLTLIGGGAANSYAQQADNTKVNKEDRGPDAVTADSQKMNAPDRELTAKIRKSLMADKSLSTYAHNVKIISQNGTVTLKGPVRSDEEVTAITAKAAELAGGPDKVVNQLSVKPKQ
jgi:hyperosmotically inducible protein